ncbi:hypothetical protein CALVIDRAFT_523864 [Calocera viscosa TUFC12733]|uniref:Retrotransposon gag domain-containing protein n=1 Tax=Calocera viscosa (strain TUFC12733) TaxID=1330018 RepID=A0A167RZX6_CALVF|nr:hypothetical protein CALVIDRAFT_523864 [Calocera viscosa TUFC12733]
MSIREQQHAELILNMQAQIQQLTEQIQPHNVTQAAAQDPQPAPNPEPTPTTNIPPINLSTMPMHIATPDVFDGEKGRAQIFLSQVALYVQARPQEFPTEQQAILFALSYMKGRKAGESASRVIQWQQEHNAPFFTSWEAFADPDPSTSARLKMDLLIQGSRLVDEYIAEFKELAGYNGTAHVEKFQQGLHRAIVDKIYSLADMPTTHPDLPLYAILAISRVI